MSKTSRTAGLAAVALAAMMVLMIVPPSGAAGDDLQEVVVANFPETQLVRGSVTVEGAVRQASFVALEDLEVPPVARGDVTRLIDAGVVETDGFGAVVLSLVGGVKGRMKEPGDVGAILLPDVQTVQHLLEERGQLRFPLEVSAPAVLTAPYFNSDQPRYVVGFPRYRVLLYNGTDTTVNVNLYTYLTN